MDACLCGCNYACMCIALCTLANVCTCACLCAGGEGGAVGGGAGGEVQGVLGRQHTARHSLGNGQTSSAPDDRQRGHKRQVHLHGCGFTLHSRSSSDTTQLL